MSSFSFLSPLALSDSLKLRRRSQSFSQAASVSAVSIDVASLLRRSETSSFNSDFTLAGCPSTSISTWALPGGRLDSGLNSRATCTVKRSATSRARQKPHLKYRANRLCCRAHRLEACRVSCPRRRQRQQFQRRFGDHAEQPFRTRKSSDEIESGLVLMRAPTATDDAAVRSDDLESEHVLARHAVFQTPRPASVCRDVSPDAAILQASGVGRVEHVLLLHCFLELSGDHRRLRHRDKISRVNLADRIHPLGRENDPALHRYASARHSRSPLHESSPASRFHSPAGARRKLLPRSMAARPGPAPVPRTTCRRRRQRAVPVRR